jgi:hypothetical protein
VAKQWKEKLLEKIGRDVWNIGICNTGVAKHMIDQRHLAHTPSVSLKVLFFTFRLVV